MYLKVSCWSYLKQYPLILAWPTTSCIPHPKPVFTIIRTQAHIIVYHWALPVPLTHLFLRSPVCGDIGRSYRKVFSGPVGALMHKSAWWLGSARGWGVGRGVRRCGNLLNPSVATSHPLGGREGKKNNLYGILMGRSRPWGGGGGWNDFWEAPRRLV